MGRALLCAPYFASTVLAATAIINAGTEAQKRALLPPIADGETIATLAFTEPNGRWDATGIETTATRPGGRFRLDGVKSFVLDGHTADLIVVLARRAGHRRGDDGLSLLHRRRQRGRSDRRALKVVDPTRKLARLTFRSVEADLLGTEGAAAAPFAKTHDPGGGLPRERNGRRGGTAAPVGTRLCQSARAVRPHRSPPSSR